MQLIPCTVALYDKEGTIQRAGCQLPGDRLRWLHLRAIDLGNPYNICQFKNLFRESRLRNGLGQGKIDVTLMKLEKEGPFNACGFFEIKRDLFCGLISNIATYLIVLIQFNDNGSSNE